MSTELLHADTRKAPTRLGIAPTSAFASKAITSRSVPFGLRRWIALALLGVFLGSLLPATTGGLPVYASTCTLSGAGTSDAPWLVSSSEDLAKVGVTPCTLSGRYLQTADIVLTVPAAGQSNHTPIGPFAGVYDGNNKSISNMTIVASTSNQGMFTQITNSGAVVKNLVLKDISVKSSGGKIGGLAGEVVTSARIENVHIAGGTVQQTGAFSYVGGLVGQLNRASVLASSSSATVTSQGYRTGGLVGSALNTPGSIADSFATGNVSGAAVLTGGLVGEVDAFPEITRSYATGNVTQSSTIDLVALNDADGVGGLLGGVRASGSLAITDSYATGNVKLLAVGGSSSGVVGGLVGFLGSNATVDRSYSTGTSSGPANANVRVWGLVGWQGTVTSGPTFNPGDGTKIRNSFWDTQTSGLSHSTGGTTGTGGTGKPTAEMTSIATFNDTATVGLAAKWDIVDAWEASAPSATPKKVWGICNASVADQFNRGYPYLLWQATSDPCALTPPSGGGEQVVATSLPRIHLDLIAKAGDVVAGAPVLIEGQGLQPGSAYSLVMRSTPTTVTTGTVSSGGRFSTTVNLPPGIAPGTHTITLTAIGSDGSTLSLVTTFVVSSAGTFASISPGVGSVVGGLAATGPNSSALSLAAASSLALVALGLAVFASSRRKVARVS